MSLQVVVNKCYRCAKEGDGEGLIEEVTLKLDLNIKGREHFKYKI